MNGRVDRIDAGGHMSAPFGDADPVRLARLALGALVEPGNRELGVLVRRAGPVGALERLCGGGVSRLYATKRGRRLLILGVKRVGH